MVVSDSSLPRIDPKVPQYSSAESKTYNCYKHYSTMSEKKAYEVKLLGKDQLISAK